MVKGETTKGMVCNKPESVISYEQCYEGSLDRNIVVSSSEELLDAITPRTMIFLRKMLRWCRSCWAKCECFKSTNGLIICWCFYGAVIAEEEERLKSEALVREETARNEKYSLQDDCV